VPINLIYLKDRIVEVRHVINELKKMSSKPYEELTVDEKNSIRYQIIVLAEAIGSMCLHIALEDLGYEPKSYSECFVYLGSKNIVRSTDDLIKIIRLRNLLVHRYWVIDDFKVYKSIKENFDCVEGFLKAVEDKYGINI
jgi:uncharacterized protein YutE (UPF0331/DUF86 family)